MIRFFSSKSKPKIYNAAIITILMLILVLFLYNMPEKNYRLIHNIVIIYLTLCFVIFIQAFIRQLQYNPYSYNSIYYIGFSLFILSSLLLQLSIAINLRNLSSDDIGIFLSMFSSLVFSGKNYMLLSFPFVLVCSLGLIIANISLIKNEGFSFTNILGIILAVILLGGEIYLYIVDYYVTGSLREVMMQSIFSNLYASVYLYFECMIIGSIIVNILVCRYKPSYDKDYIVILGCGLLPDGKPTPLLSGRIQRALKFYNDQINGSGKKAVFITSGGKGADEAVSESCAMKQYLIDSGISEKDIIEEDKSTDTYENMLYSKKIIDDYNPDAKAVFSTSNFHVFRSGIKSRLVKLNGEGIGSKTKWYFWPNATVREFVGLISKHRIKQAIVLTCMILLYCIATYVLYIYL